jgi:hypothetical protein
MPRALAQIAAGASAALVLALMAHAAAPHQRPPVGFPARIAEGPSGPSAKSDRLGTIAPIAFVDRVSFPAPPATLPIRSPLPIRSAATDICTRHHGWKVVTDGGRSWHCAYRHL